ncbi:MAG: hypothetical protein AB7F43_09505 [Bacteriovoracia bacterium]
MTRKKVATKKRNRERFHLVLLIIYVGGIAFGAGAMAKELFHLYRSPPPKSPVTNAVLMVAANEVLKPDYVEEDESAEVKSENKFQYQPGNDDAPILEEKESEELTASGVEYPKTEEVFITMEPNFMKKAEDIIENEQTSEEENTNRYSKDGR